MITFGDCVACTGLASNPLFLGVATSAKHHSMLLRYLFNVERNSVPT